MIDQEVLDNVKILWEYHSLTSPLKKADFILVMGSADDRVAIHAAYLFKLGYSGLVVPSGGYGKVTKDLYKIAEGERFAEIIKDCGVPHEAIQIETRASNSGENLLFVKEIFDKKAYSFTSGILVTKPYMKRRAFATAMKQWPEINWEVSAPQLSFEMYLNESITFEMVVNLMVGDLQRIQVYADKGFQIPQLIPAEVWSSYEFLRDRGFDKYVINEE